MPLIFNLIISGIVMTSYRESTAQEYSGDCKCMDIAPSVNTSCAQLAKLPNWCELVWVTTSHNFCESSCKRCTCQNYQNFSSVSNTSTIIQDKNNSIYINLTQISQFLNKNYSQMDFSQNQIFVDSPSLEQDKLSINHKNYDQEGAFNTVQINQAQIDVKNQTKYKFNLLYQREQFLQQEKSNNYDQTLQINNKSQNLNNNGEDYNNQFTIVNDSSNLLNFDIQNITQNVQNTNTTSSNFINSSSKIQNTSKAENMKDSDTNNNRESECTFCPMYFAKFSFFIFVGVLIGILWVCGKFCECWTGLTFDPQSNVDDLQNTSQLYGVLMQLDQLYNSEQGNFQNSNSSQNQQNSPRFLSTQRVNSQQQVQPSGSSENQISNNVYRNDSLQSHQINFISGSIEWYDQSENGSNSNSNQQHGSRDQHQNSYSQQAPENNRYRNESRNINTQQSSLFLQSSEWYNYSARQDLANDHNERYAQNQRSSTNQRARSSSNLGQQQFQPNFSSTSSLLYSLPSASLAEREKQGDCGICLGGLREDLEEGDRAVVLPCFHVFHKNCIKEWIELKKAAAKCPLLVFY